MTLTVDTVEASQTKYFDMVQIIKGSHCREPQERKERRFADILWLLVLL